MLARRPIRSWCRGRTQASLLFLLAFIPAGCADRDRPVGEIQGAPHTVESIRRVSDDRASAGAALSRESRPSQILFGDLHVHTTYSIDAFMFSLPLFGG